MWQTIARVTSQSRTTKWSEDAGSRIRELNNIELEEARWERLRCVSSAGEETPCMGDGNWAGDWHADLAICRKQGL